MTAVANPIAEATTGASAPQILQASVTAALNPGTATQVSVQARDHAFTIDEPADLGGTDTGANPVEHLLAALGSCQIITYQVWAEKLGLQLDTVEVELTGDIDLRGFFGLAKGVRPGFQSIQVQATITGPESQADYDRLIATVEKHCPVLDNLAAAVPVKATAVAA